MRQGIIFGLAAFVIAGMTGWLGWRWLHPADKACAKFVELCKRPDTAIDQCREQMKDIHDRLGGSIERLTGHCMVDAQNCNESLSCISHADRRANEMKTH